MLVPDRQLKKKNCFCFYVKEWFVKWRKESNSEWVNDSKFDKFILFDLIKMFRDLEDLGRERWA